MRGTVADLGAGGGSAVDPSSALRVRAAGAARLVEVDQRNISQQPGPLRVVAELDGASLPFVDGALDAAVCNHVLEHLHRADDLLAEIARVVRPQGFLVCAVPNGRAFSDRLFRAFYRVFHRDPVTFDGHVQRYSREGFARALRGAGFEPAAMVDMGESYSWLHKHPVLQRVLTGATAALRRVHNDAFIYGWWAVARRG